MLKIKNLKSRYISIILVLAIITTLFNFLSISAVAATNLALNTSGIGYPQVSASYTFSYDNVWEVVNGVINYAATPDDRWTSYESPNATDWLAIDFGTDKTISQANLYIYSDGGGVKAPASYNVQYWNGTDWMDAASQSNSPAAPTGGALNTVTFTSVNTQKVRVVFTHMSGAKTGVTELELYSVSGGTPTPTPTPTPVTNVALNISGIGYPEVTASYTSSYDNVWEAVNGVIVYTDSPHDRWTSYQSLNSTDWLAVDFGTAKTVSQAKVYIYDDNGGVKAPVSYNVQYWNGTTWVDAVSQSKSPIAPAGSAVNTVTFTAVSTEKVRVVFTHTSGAKTGVTELELYATGGTVTPTPTPTPTP